LKRAFALAASALPFVHLAVAGCTALKAGDDRSDAAAQGCVHREPPPRPGATGSGGSLDLVFAVSSSSYGTMVPPDGGKPGYPGFGFDLDETCTGQDAGSSCLEPPWAAEVNHNDGVDGIDNAAGALLSNLLPGANDTTPASVLNAELLFRVRGYSGDADDDQVDAAVYIAYGLEPRADLQTGPYWDGLDRWTILPDVLQPRAGGAGSYDIDDPRYHDSTAYVSGGVLVMHLAETLWPSGVIWAPSAVGPVQGFVMAGHIGRTGSAGAWELTDMVTGIRANVLGLLDHFSRFPEQGDASTLICQDPLVYEAFKAKLCSYVDIATSGNDPAVPCNALSGGSVLQAKAAMLGSVGSPAEALPSCNPGIDPATDSCGSP
jgi:hypothetical protein